MIDAVELTMIERDGTETVRTFRDTILCTPKGDIVRPVNEQVSDYIKARQAAGATIISQRAWVETAVGEVI